MINNISYFKSTYYSQLNPKISEDTVFGKKNTPNIWDVGKKIKK